MSAGVDHNASINAEQVCFKQTFTFTSVSQCVPLVKAKLKRSQNKALIWEAVTAALVIVL